MARGLVSAINQAVREGERQARRRQAQAVRDEQAEYKRQTAEIKANYLRARQDEAQALNDQLEEYNAAIDGILAATLYVDDFYDLKRLYRKVTHPLFTSPEFETPTSPPELISDPPEPSYAKPSSWRALLERSDSKLRYLRLKRLMPQH